MAYFYWFFENVEVGERRRSKQKGIIIPLLLLTLSFKETPWPAITLCAASLSLQTDKTVKCLLCLLLFSMSQRKVCFEYGLCHSQFLEIQCQLRLWGRMLTKKKKKIFLCFWQMKNPQLHYELCPFLLFYYSSNCLHAIVPLLCVRVNFVFSQLGVYVCCVALHNWFHACQPFLSTVRI